MYVGSLNGSKLITCLRVLEIKKIYIYECKEIFFPLTLDGKKILKRATNLKMSCINNASEPLKEKNSGPEHNYENSGSTLLSCVIHHYFLAKAGYSFIGVWRVGKKSPFMLS